MFVCLFKGHVVELDVALQFETVFAVFPWGPVFPPLSKDVSRSAG